MAAPQAVALADFRPQSLAQRDLALAIHQGPRMTAQRQALQGVFGRPRPRPVALAAPLQRLVTIPGNFQPNADQVIAWLKVAAAGAATGKVADALDDLFKPGTPRRTTLDDLIKAKKPTYEVDERNVFELLGEHFGIQNRQAITDSQARTGNTETPTLTKGKKGARGKPLSRANTKSNRSKATSDDDAEEIKSSKTEQNTKTPTPRGGHGGRGGRGGGLTPRNEPPRWQQQDESSSSGEELEVKSKSKFGALSLGGDLSSEDEKEEKKAERKSPRAPTKTSRGGMLSLPSRRDRILPSSGGMEGATRSTSDYGLETSIINSSPKAEKEPKFPDWQEPRKTFSGVRLIGPGKKGEAKAEKTKDVQVRSIGILLEEASGIVVGCKAFLSRPLLCEQATAELLQARAASIQSAILETIRRLESPKPNREGIYSQEVSGAANQLMALEQEAEDEQGHLLQCVKLLYGLGLKGEDGFKTACTTLRDKYELSGMKKIVGELLGATVVEQTLGGPHVTILRDILALEIVPAKGSSDEDERKAILPMEGDSNHVGIPKSDFDGLVCQNSPGGLQILHTVEAKGGQEDPSAQITGKQRPFLINIASDQTKYCFGRMKGKVWENLNAQFNFAALLVGEHKTITAGPAEHFTIDFTQVLGVSYSEFEAILRFIAFDNFG